MGVSILIGALLIRADEERRLRNQLVDWWVEVTETRETWADAVAIALRALAAEMLDLLNSIFGKRLLTLRFVVGSICVNVYAGAGFFLMAARALRGLWYGWVALAAGAVTMCFVYRSIRSRGIDQQLSESRIEVWFLLGGPLIALMMVPITDNDGSFYDRALCGLLCCAAQIVLAAIVVALDFVTVPLNRRLVKSAADSPARALLLPLMIVVPGSFFLWVLTFGPSEAPPLLPQILARTAPNWQDQLMVYSGLAIVGSALSVNGMIALVLTATFAVLVLNGLAWGVLQRVLVTLHERGLSRRQMFAVAWLLILAGLFRPAGYGHLAEFFNSSGRVGGTEVEAPTPATR